MPRRCVTLKDPFPVLTEHAEQARLMRWADLLGGGPVAPLRMLFAIPNGGARHKAVAGKLRAEGVKQGVPDLFLPVPSGGKCGLFLEMKRTQGGRVSPEQMAWLEELESLGYATAVCRGAGEASRVLLEYLGYAGKYSTL